MTADRDSDTICALSTPPGFGGISVIRISGDKSSLYAAQICKGLPERLESHKTYLTSLVDFEGVEIDESLVTFFGNGNSFTGEETIEINCHGSPVVVEEILKHLVLLGCRPADRGEFTYRAFINDRIDLIQAESVLALIESRSSSAAKVALRQMKGNLSREFSFIEERLTWCLANLEASIDFSTEGLDVLDEGELEKTLEELRVIVSRLVGTFRKGQILRRGYTVALAGKPNVGKSSVLNALLNEDRAIVTDIPGTTRDIIEGYLRLTGGIITVQDTAGLRETEDKIEVKGIEKSRTAMDESDLVLFVFDVSLGLDDEEIREVTKIPVNKLILVPNKSDLLDGKQSDIEQYRALCSRIFPVSAVRGTGISSLSEFLGGSTQESSTEEQSIVFQARHHSLLKNIQECLERADKALKLKYSPEFVALEFQEALVSVFEMIGSRVDEEVLDRIFKEFCLGK